jgi:hypothetical protein
MWGKNVMAGKARVLYVFVYMVLLSRSFKLRKMGYLLGCSAV